MIDKTTLKFDAAGLIPAIIQDADTRVVLMQGYMNPESLDITQQTGKYVSSAVPANGSGPKERKADISCS